MITRNYIITGAPGTGKTSIISELKSRGWNCYGEVARAVIIEESTADSDALPYRNTLAFTEKVVSQMSNHLIDCEEHEVNFFDRGLPDSAGYLLLEGIEIPTYLKEKIAKSRYEKKVFIAPFWEDIYTTDTQRLESAEVARDIDRALRKSYNMFGFELIEIPTGTVEERTNFILDNL